MLLGGGIILQSKTVSPVEAIQFVLNQPVSVCINGCENMENLNQAFEAVKTFKSMNEQQVSMLLSKTKQAAMGGKYELFKTSNRFDATAKNPKWLG
jgi:hypothetical protein